jgi:hypothetical protein
MPERLITVELLGVARLLARQDAVTIPYPAAGTVRELVRALAIRLPVLTGSVITAEGAALVQGYALSLDGRTWTRDPDAPLEGASRVLLLSNVAGGTSSRGG